jgi:DNA-directed RNA polymerase specialized sigma24 family protein
VSTESTRSPRSPQGDPDAAPDLAEIGKHIDRGDDQAALQALMQHFGDAVLARCTAALADLGDPTLGGEARHDTFIEAFRSIGPLKSLPEPEAFLMELADAQCATIRRLEKTRRLPREPLPEAGALGDWKAAVQWEIEVLLQERPEGPDRMAARLKKKRRGPSIWPALLLGLLTVVLILVMRRYL